MPKTSSLRVPSYRRHKPTNQAVVTINGQDIYLGKWNTAASKAEYDRLIAEFLANGRRLQSDSDGTVVEVLNAYRKFAEDYYRKGGRVTSEYGGIKEALKLVRELYGRTTVSVHQHHVVLSWVDEVGHSGYGIGDGGGTAMVGHGAHDGVDNVASHAPYRWSRAGCYQTSNAPSPVRWAISSRSQSSCRSRWTRPLVRLLIE